MLFFTSIMSLQQRIQNKYSTRSDCVILLFPQIVAALVHSRMKSNQYETGAEWTARTDTHGETNCNKDLLTELYDACVTTFSAKKDKKLVNMV